MENDSDSEVIELHILSYNVNLLPIFVNPVGHRSKSARLSRFLSELQTRDYDIIALQEVFSSPYVLGL